MKTIVLDTNVLLADPQSLLAFREAEVVIPETVLGELDKLKTSRVDPDLRFRGREVSRILFELSEQGSLIEGVDLPDGGRLRVVPLDSDLSMPDGLTTRNADDRILAVAFQLCHSGGCAEGLTMVTNDLNMLLKAQTYGLEVERYADGPDGGFAKRYIIRPFQRYRVPLGILGTSLAVFAAIIFITIWGPGARDGVPTAVPVEFRDQLPAAQQRILDYLTILERDETNLDTRLSLANLYYELRLTTGDVRYSSLAIRHYERYLELRPESSDVRADLAASYFYGGQTDRAIQEATRILEQDPDHVQATFNLGVFYWRGRQDFAAAATQFARVIDLTADGDEQAQSINQEATAALQQVRQEAADAGQPLPEGGTF
jgi:hypothetical protein